MPQTISELLELLDLTQVDDLVFRGRHPETHMQRSFGGQVMAQALSAAYSTMPDARRCHSLSGYFLRPGSTAGPIDYHVLQTRDGRGFSTRRVAARQHDKDIFVMSASFKGDEPGLEHQQHPTQPAAPPQSCPPLASVLGRLSERAAQHWEEEWGVLDVRYVASCLDNPLDERAWMTVWVKTIDPIGDDPRLHQEVLAYLSDLTILAVSSVPHRFDFYGPHSQVATINHSMWFHRPIRADGWVLYDQQSPNASNALGFSIGQLYANGVLGASCAQEGLIRVLDAETPSE